MCSTVAKTGASQNKVPKNQNNVHSPVSEKFEMKNFDYPEKYSDPADNALSYIRSVKMILYLLKKGKFQKSRNIHSYSLKDFSKVIFILLLTEFILQLCTVVSSRFFLKYSLNF